MKKENHFNLKKFSSGLSMAVLMSVNNSADIHHSQELLFNLRDNSPNLIKEDVPVKENIIFLASNTETAPPSQLPSPSPFESSHPSPTETLSPTPTPEPSLSPEEKRTLKIKKELEEVNKIIEANPGKFNKKQRKDINLYFPIYKPVADKFHIDWYLLWIVHEAETGASAGTRGFAPESYYKGAMQRDPYTWPESYVKEAAKGLEYLSKFPQRHTDDWREIAAGAAILDRNIDHYKHLGNDRAVLNALRLYTPGAGGYRRFDKYKEYKKVFNQ